MLLTENHANSVNALILGDNLGVIRKLIDSDSVDLIYLDPPFCSLQNYRLLNGNGDTGSRLETPTFEDTWRWNSSSQTDYEELMESASPKLKLHIGYMKEIWGEASITAYICMMALRLVELQRVLKQTGSIYLHCDQYASAHLRILMDVIFGRVNFLNHIVWCYGLGGSSNRRWPRKHDDIFWYSKEPDKQYFEAIKIPATSQRMKGQLKKAPDYWYIPSINNMAKERTGYPTQKPRELLERIITSSSREGDIVLDPFCGSGTTLSVAQRGGRNWMGIDQNIDAIGICKKRLEKHNASFDLRTL